MNSCIPQRRQRPWQCLLSVSLFLTSSTSRFHPTLAFSSTVSKRSRSVFTAHLPRIATTRRLEWPCSTILLLSASSSSSTSLPVTQQNITEYSEISDWIDDEDESLSEVSDQDDIEAADEAADEALQADYDRWTKAVHQAVKALKKKRTSLEAELEKAQGAEDTMQKAQLLVSNLYVFQEDASIKTATVMDWENNVEVELTLDDKYDSAAAEADALFAQARKLKRGSKVVADLLEETANAWEVLQSAQEDLRSASNGVTIDEGRLALVKDRLMRTSRTTKFQIPSSESDDNNSNRRNSNPQQQQRQRKPELGTPASNIRKLNTPAGCTIYVGRNRRGNEYLSLSLARGDDIWMHSRGCPGAHVLIVNRRGGPKVTDDCIQLAADLAIFYSDLRNEAKAAVTAALPKHILKPRGAPLGAVKIREEWKTFVGWPDRVPENLKMAREESGQTDEYHMMDKAKHRRRTKQAAEEDQNKRRQRQREQKRSQ